MNTTAQMGLITKLPPQPQSERVVMTEDEIAAKWMAKAVREGHKPRCIKIKPKRQRVTKIDRVLTALREQGPMSAREIAEHIRDHTHLVSTVLSELKAQGRVSRHPIKGNRASKWNLT